MPTKTINSTNLRNNLSDAIGTVVEGNVLIVKKRGKDQVAIVDIDKFEDLLSASDPGYLASIREARESKERFSPEEAFGDLWNEVE